MNHSHILYDSDPHFKIDTVSRSIINESSKKTKLVQHDHNSERFTFEMARHIEGHDMASCNLVEVHYLNIESNTKIVHAGVYTVDDLHIKADDENSVVCSWLIPNNATQLVGQLQFLLRFACVNDDSGKIEYVWNTGVYTNITISSGIYNSESQSDNIVPAYNFVTTINGDTLKFFVGTKAEYFALTNELRNGLFAILTDDTTKDDMNNAISQLEEDVGRITSILDHGGIDFANRARCDELNNVIHETYGNFAGEWIERSIIDDEGTLTLSGAGTYLVCVKLTISEYNDVLQDYFYYTRIASTIVYYDGVTTTYASLCDTTKDEDGISHSYRLKMANDTIGTPKAYVQKRSWSPTYSALDDYVDMVDTSDVEIKARKIL